MSETVLVNAVSVLAAESTTVEAYQILVPPEVDFRVECDNVHSVRFYVADVDFALVADGAIVSAYTETAVPSTTSTNGNVYRVDAGSYDYIACVVTNDGVDASAITVAVGYDLVAEAPTALFTVVEARAFNDATLASATDYTNAEIIAFEAAFREWFAVAAGVAFIPTVHTAEIHDGDGSNYIELDWPMISTVTAISVDGVAFTASELSTTDYSGGLAIDPELPIVTRRSGTFNAGWANVSVTYAAGHAAIPALVKEAALTAATIEVPAQSTPYEATSFDAGGGSYSFDRADGYNENWSKLPVVMRALRLYTRKMPGIA